MEMLQKVTIEDGTNVNIDNWLFMSSPYPVLTIIASYILFVFLLGPQLMNSRPAFNLKYTILIYNVIQVIYSVYMVVVGSLLMHSRGLFKSSIDGELKKDLLRAGYIYFIAKVTELLDTVFFTLRKKQNQITFLHVYHHTVMVINTWIGLKYDPSYMFLFIGTLNSLVHVVMYSYYGLSSFPSLRKYLWWKKYITSMQLIQFVLIIIYGLVSYMLGCQVSVFMFITLLFNTALFIFLFSNFYMNTYKKKVEKDL